MRRRKSRTKRDQKRIFVLKKGEISGYERNCYGSAAVFGGFDGMDISAEQRGGARKEQSILSSGYSGDRPAEKAGIPYLPAGGYGGLPAALCIKRAGKVSGGRNGAGRFERAVPFVCAGGTSGILVRRADRTGDLLDPFCRNGGGRVPFPAGALLGASL